MAFFKNQLVFLWVVDALANQQQCNIIEASLTLFPQGLCHVIYYHSGKKVPLPSRNRVKPVLILHLWLILKREADVLHRCHAPSDHLPSAS